MPIENILYQLLLEHECVILPDFGGFIVRESPCNFNVSKEILKPYSKSVFFNQHLQENDGLLINAISKSKNISYTEANLILTEWINGISELIENDGKAGISKIGIFFKGNEGSKWFTPDSSLNLSLSTYGLRPVKAGVVIQVVEEEEFAPIEFKPLADNKPIETFTLPKTNWKAWAAAAAIALVAHIGYLTIESLQKPASHQASILPVISQPEIVQETPVVNNDTLVTEETTPEVVAQEEVITPETIVPENTKEEETSKNETQAAVTEESANQAEVKTEGEIPPANIELDSVAGRYKLEINALNHLKDLTKSGITSKIEKNAEGLFEVKVPLLKSSKNN